MCGRYAIYPPNPFTPEQLEGMAHARKRPPRDIEWNAQNPIRCGGEILHVKPMFDIRPTQTGLPFIVEDGVRYGRWGMVPSWWKKPLKELPSGFNAQSERLTESGMWRGSFKSRRCLVPMSGFYEWQYQPDGSTVRHFIRLREPEMFSCAGLWDEWKPASGEAVLSFTIITCAANPLMAQVHNKPRQGGPRMPVILDTNSAGEWLDTSFQEDQSDHATRLKGVLQPFPQDKMLAYPVGNKGSGPELVQPVGPGLGE